MLAGLAFIGMLHGCGEVSSRQGRIDRSWHQQSLAQDHLKHWLASAETTNGFFFSARDRHWQATPAQPGEVVAQARLVYVLAAGYELSRDPAYLARMKQGADFLLSAYLDPDYGAYFDAVSPEGKVSNDAKRLYSQAFVILALASSYRVSKDPRYSKAALAAWKTVDEHFRDAAGGYYTSTDRGFTGGSGNAQNPIMHLFEALLALHAATGDEAARQGALRVGNFAAYKLLVGLPDGSACIPEYFHTRWEVLTTEQGGYIDVGHQFEWAWLLNQAARQGISPVYAGVADRLFDFALKRGIDPTDGSIYSAVTYKGMKDGSKGYWQQAEGLRAMLYYAVAGKRDDLWGHITQLTDFIQTELVDKENGGWYLHPIKDCRNNPACMTQQPDAYHMTALHTEALRLTDPAADNR